MITEQTKKTKSEQLIEVIRDLSQHKDTIAIMEVYDKTKDLWADLRTLKNLFSHFVTSGILIDLADSGFYRIANLDKYAEYRENLKERLKSGRTAERVRFDPEKANSILSFINTHGQITSQQFINAGLEGITKKEFKSTVKRLALQGKIQKVSKQRWISNEKKEAALISRIRQEEREKLMPAQMPLAMEQPNGVSENNNASNDTQDQYEETTVDVKPVSEVERNVLEAINAICARKSFALFTDILPVVSHLFSGSSDLVQRLLLSLTQQGYIQRKENQYLITQDGRNQATGQLSKKILKKIQKAYDPPAPPEVRLISVHALLKGIDLQQELAVLQAFKQSLMEKLEEKAKNVIYDNRNDADFDLTHYFNSISAFEKSTSNFISQFE